jgi:hypothetical protein
MGKEPLILLKDGDAGSTPLRPKMRFSIQFVKIFDARPYEVCGVVVMGAMQLLR